MNPVEKPGTKYLIRAWMHFPYCKSRDTLPYFNLTGGKEPLVITSYRHIEPEYESEFCMGGHIRIDNLPYKFFITVLSCTKE